MTCHIKDAYLNKCKGKEYFIRPSISKWNRVPMLNADHLLIFALATNKTVKWLDDIAPAHVDVGATA